MIKPTPLQPSQRDRHLDVLGGIMILYMVYVHYSGLVVWEEGMALRFQLIPFFMSWFYFKGGMFFTPGTLSRAYVWSNFKRLIVPVLAFSLVGLFCVFWRYESWGVAVKVLVGGLVRYGSTPLNISLWYLTSLFLVRIVCRLGLKSTLCGVVLILIGGVVAWYGHGAEEFAYKLLIERVALGVVFFVSGFLLRRVQYAPWLVGLAMAFYAWSLCTGLSYIHLVSNDLEFGQYWHFFPLSLSGIIIVNALARWVASKGCDFMAMLGKNSLFILCVHFPIAQLVDKGCDAYGLPIGFGRMVVVSVVSLLILCLLFPLFKRTRLKVLLGE